MPVVVTASAQLEIREISDYIALENPIAAARVRERIRRAILQLAEFPRSGPSGLDADSRRLRVGRTPYVIHYDLVGDELHVLHIVPGARRWPAAEDE